MGTPQGECSTPRAAAVAAPPQRWPGCRAGEPAPAAKRLLSGSARRLVTAPLLSPDPEGPPDEAPAPVYLQVTAHREAGEVAVSYRLENTRRRGSFPHEGGKHGPVYHPPVVDRRSGEILIPSHELAVDDCRACEDRKRRQAATAAGKARRAANAVRRYCKANGIGLLWTLTYRGEGVHDLAVAAAQMRRFQQRITEVLWPKYGRFPYLIVCEWHPGGHGLHWHMGFPRFVDYRDLNPLWSHGGSYSPRVRNERGFRPSLKDCARYLSKYVAKTYDGSPVVPAGYHRYRLAQGFAHPPVRASAVSRTGPEAFQQLMRAMGELMGGRAPVACWASDDVPDWTGPPTWLFYYDVGA